MVTEVSTDKMVTLDQICRSQIDLDLNMHHIHWSASVYLLVHVCEVCLCVFVTSDYAHTWLCVPQRSDNMSAHVYRMETRSYHSVMRPTLQILPLITSSRLFGCQHTVDTLQIRYEHEPHHVCREEVIRDMNRKQNRNQEAYEKLAQERLNGWKGEIIIKK